MASLRARLTATLLAAIVAIASVAMLVVYLNARQEVDEMFDFEIGAVARSYGSASPGDLGTHVPDDEVLVQLWSEPGALAFSSDPRQAVPRATVAGYSELDGPQGAYRVFTRPFGTATIQVSQSLASRRELAVEYSLRLLAPLIVAIPLMGVAIWWLTKHTLRPVDRLGAALASRKESALEPVETRPLPDELLPLVDGFNRLLGRLRAAFDAQRALVADAAHELRTPLAAVQIQAQSLQRLDGTGPQATAIEALLGGVRRATRVVQQLLTLARTDAPSVRAVEESIDLTELVRSTLAELLPLAEAKHIEVVFEAPAPVAFRGDPGALHALVSNLVDNAIKYTPDAGRIEVTLADAAESVRLQVSDTGPGIPEAQRGPALDRFYRVPGSSADGSGLGLAIAAAVVQHHAGRLALRSAVGGGLCVDVRFPKAGQALA